MAEQTKKQATNTFTIVGTLKSVEYRNKEKMAEQVSARAVIESLIGGITKSFEVEFFSKAVTAAGAPNKLYAAYCDLEKNIGKKIKVNGELRENRYYSATKESVVSTNTLSGRFINYNPSDSDTATFEFQGFVVRELSEKTNKDGEVYQYNLSIGQEGFKENSLNVITFNVDVNPESSGIVSYIRDNYTSGSSVIVIGELDFQNKTTTKEISQEGGFGGPIVREYTNTYRNYFVTQGTAPISPSEDKALYNDEKIAALIEAYKANDVKLQEDAKEDTKAAPAQSAPAPAAKKRTGSLI